MDHDEISLKQSITNKINSLIKLQEFDLKIIKIILTKSDAAKEWEDLYKQGTEVTHNLEQAKKNNDEINTSINTKQDDLNCLVENIKVSSNLQSQSKKVEEYNIHQQKIIEHKKQIRDLEHEIDDLNSRKQKVEENLSIFSIAMNEYFSEFKTKSLHIEKKIEKLNDTGKSLMKDRDCKKKTVSDIDGKLLKQYEMLINRKMNNVVVPIDGQSCYGCNILLTNNDISIVRRGLSIESCEHCSRILYFIEQKQEIETSKTPTKRSRKVFTKPTAISL